MTPVYDFTWRGQSAHDDFGVETMKIGSTVISERRDSTEVVAGRSGLVHMQDGAVEEVELQMTIYIPTTQGRTVAGEAAIRKWLKGYGKLTTSTLLGRYRMAYITDQIALDPVVDGIADVQGTVIFRCEPYLYHTSAAIITKTVAGNLVNPGNCESRPKITVNATGDIDLMIDGQTILLTGLTGQIVIDSTVDEAYTVDSNGKLHNANNMMSGDFPVIPAGTSQINWSVGEASALTSIVITPYWRDEH